MSQQQPLLSAATGANWSPFGFSRSLMTSEATEGLTLAAAPNWLSAWWTCTLVRLLSDKGRIYVECWCDSFTFTCAWQCLNEWRRSSKSPTATWLAQPCILLFSDQRFSAQTRGVSFFKDWARKYSALFFFMESRRTLLSKNILFTLSLSLIRQSCCQIAYQALEDEKIEELWKRVF